MINMHRVTAEEGESGVREGERGSPIFEVATLSSWVVRGPQ